VAPRKINNGRLKTVNKKCILAYNNIHIETGAFKCIKAFIGESKKN